MTRLIRSLRALGRDTGAISAVEFAILLPVILLLLLGSFDIARAVDVKTKTTVLSRTISDLVSQSDQITSSELAVVVQAARSVMYPYPFDSSVLSVSVESVRENPSNPGTYIIDWSYAQTANATDRPSTFSPPVPSVIRTTVSYTYHLKFAGFLGERLGFDSLTMRSATDMTPRSVPWVELK